MLSISRCNTTVCPLPKSAKRQNGTRKLLLLWMEAAGRAFRKSKIMRMAKHDNEFVFKYLTIASDGRPKWIGNHEWFHFFELKKHGEKVKVFYSTAAATSAFRHLCSYHILVLVWSVFNVHPFIIEHHKLRDDHDCRILFALVRRMQSVISATAVCRYSTLPLWFIQTIFIHPFRQRQL